MSNPCSRNRSGLTLGEGLNLPRTGALEGGDPPGRGGGHQALHGESRIGPHGQRAQRDEQAHVPRKAGDPGRHGRPDPVDFACKEVDGFPLHFSVELARREPHRLAMDRLPQVRHGVRRKARRRHARAGSADAAGQADDGLGERTLRASREALHIA